MKKKMTSVIHVEMDLSQLDDPKLKTLVSGILQTAPNSALYASSPVIQACIAALKTASGDHDQAESTVIADRAKLAADLDTLMDARVALLTIVVQYRGLIETTAKSTGDVSAAGLTARERTVSTGVKVPTGINIFYPKRGHGRAKVTVQFDRARDRHDCQICLDPIGQNAWTDLDGDGRSHWLAGYKSGTVIWARFRAVRGHQKSDWCNPVTVTIP